jgi:hypothetical protein
VGGTHPLKREEHVGGTHPKKKKKLNTTCCVKVIHRHKKAKLIKLTIDVSYSLWDKVI